MSDRPAEEQAVAQPSVGDKVNAIIAAAESAAQEITDKARLEAHNILRWRSSRRRSGSRS
jgi:hypothetical protein